MEAFPANIMRVSCDVLENLCYLFADNRALDAEEPAASLICCLAFSGERRGELWIKTSKNLVLEIAKNMLGYDDLTLPAWDTQQDAFAEFCNVLGGNLLPAIFETSVPLQLTLPAIKQQWPDEDYIGAEGFVAQRLALEVDYHGIDIVLLIKQADFHEQNL